MHQLMLLDYALFDWIQSALRASQLDLFFAVVRNKFIWVPLYFLIVTWLFSSHSRYRALIVFFSLITLVALTDFLSGQVLKKTLQRERPCIQVERHVDLDPVIPCRQSYSFPSAHAANHFAMATFLAMFVSGWKQTSLFLWAALISFAQIYVGLHYPMDVFAGAILGILLARFVYRYMTVPGIKAEVLNRYTDNRPT